VKAYSKWLRNGKKRVKTGTAGGLGTNFGGREDPDVGFAADATKLNQSGQPDEKGLAGPMKVHPHVVGSLLDSCSGKLNYYV